MTTWNGTFSDGDMYAACDTAPNTFRMFIRAYNERVKATAGVFGTPLPVWYQFGGSGESTLVSPETQAGNFAASNWASLQANVVTLAKWFVCTKDNTGAPFSFEGLPTFGTGSTFLSNPINSWYSAYMAGGSYFPNSHGDFTRKYPREIRSLSQLCVAGSTGNIARLIPPNVPVGNNITGYPNKDPAWDGGTFTLTATDLANIGRYFSWSGTAWVPAPTATYSDIITAYGHVQAGDLIGPWIATDIRDALNLLTVVFGNADDWYFGTPVQNSLPWPSSSFGILSDIPAGTPQMWIGSTEYTGNDAADEAAVIADWHLDDMVGGPAIFNYFYPGDISSGPYRQIRCSSAGARLDNIPIVAKESGANMQRVFTVYWAAWAFPTFRDWNGHGLTEEASHAMGGTITDSNNSAVAQAEFLLNSTKPEPPWPSSTSGTNGYGWQGNTIFALADWGASAAGFDYSIHSP